MGKKFLFTLLLCITLLAACSQDDDSKVTVNADSGDGKKIGVVLMSLNSEYWKIHVAGAKKAAEELGVQVDILGPTEETLYEQQVKMVEDLVSSDVDGLVVAPSLPEAMLPILEKASAKSIPVVLADSNVDGFDKRVTFIGTENFDAAFKGGEFISDQLKENDKVLIVRGQMGAKVHDERTEGFKAALEDKNIQFIIQDAQSDRVKAVNIVENTLTADPDIKAVFATSDEMALGSYKGLENKNSTKIPLIGFDGTPDGLQAVVDGKLIANIAQDPYQMGYLGVQSAYKAMNGETVDERIDSGAEVYTIDNAEERLKEIEGYLGK
ncbi:MULTISPECIES: sugar ABC transporter substrate-binding protein [unclassified Sporosarcina]|uniref:sugar ABC transporter substrate-binding protein n=1 Tax=unclassified Sporosarcina TaxID=2647733 RepID=UPI00203FD16D|nr:MULTISPECIES: sugar ABC transporter substrate-binding protein [unclassified Sporosarcina]GKV65856.1 hypothetical protein NCCP2331_20090 [Sporosarcina sp. NCCP-2331]GLB55981.1 hypothetical protein NCCP2378_17680 [Sporosarcina sp. NCCP-2378]